MVTKLRRLLFGDAQTKRSLPDPPQWSGSPSRTGRGRPSGRCLRSRPPADLCHVLQNREDLGHDFCSLHQKIFLSIDGFQRHSARGCPARPGFPILVPACTDVMQFYNTRFSGELQYFAVQLYRFSTNALLLTQQLAHGIAGQRLCGALHRADALVQRQGAVQLGDEGADGLLLVRLAADDGTDLLAHLLDDALLDVGALAQQLLQLFGLTFSPLSRMMRFFLRPVM